MQDDSWRDHIVRIDNLVPVVRSGPGVRSRDPRLDVVRRSVAQIPRQVLKPEHCKEYEIFLENDRFDNVSDLHAPISPDNLRRALAEAER